MEAQARSLGSVVALWRYPIKSMMGEELNAADVTARGLWGDRAFALFDPSTGKVVSAKNPRKWGALFDFRSAFVNPPRLGESLPHVRVTLPNGKTTTSSEGDAGSILSEALGRSVELISSAPEGPSLEDYWPDIEGLAYREKVTDEAMPEDSFFDLAVLHLLTTATLDRLRELYPQGRFEVRRFRPNIVVETPPNLSGFVENDWVGRTLSLGDEVRLKVTDPCP
ncbi:MAG: MOSC N-terminal beta barrel domain-containing protein, partial [Thermoplasmata archaeon]|nr:MOSC N-terminal beta barrel domain-containing protein [Thermoplasmata archaeon]